MSKLHILQALLFFILISSVSYAQDFQNVPLFARLTSDNIDLESGDEVFRARKIWFNRLRDETYDNVKIAIPSQAGSVIVYATRKEIAPAEGVKVTTQSGQYFLADLGTHYLGEIEGQQSSSVIISIKQDKLHILIQDDSRKLRVINNHPDEVNRFLFKDVIEQGSGYSCPSGYSSNSNYKKPKSELRRSFGCDTICNVACSGTTDIHVYYEMDFLAFLDEGGSISNCIDFMDSTHVVVNHIYNNIDHINNNQHIGHPDLGSDINMIFSGLHIWDFPDSYTNGTSDFELNARLSEFQALRPVFNGDVAHLISKGTIEAGGISSIDESNTSASLCDTFPPIGVTPHSISFLSNNRTNYQSNVFSYGTALIAHEIGHTLGGGHTSECRWYANDSIAIESSPNCQFGQGCIDSMCTVIDTFQATIMSRCWNTASDSTTIDYANPFHREVALNILENLCNINLCYIPCNSDMDLDGYCDDEDCAKNDPTLPGIVGQQCSDGLFNTVNDTIVDTTGDTLSCLCQGTAWSNSANEDECNLIIGGDLTFEGDMIGSAEGTWYGGLETGWTTSPGNTPDIGHAMVGGVCEKFIGFAGQWYTSATPAKVGIKEGIAIALSDPIPCNVGQVHVSFDYSLINVEPDSSFNTNLVSIQGSENLISMMGHECPITDVICLATAAPVNTACIGNSHSGVFEGDCNVNLGFCSQPAMTLVNSASFDLNFIYLSFNVNESFPDDSVHELFLDNISVNILPQSYGDISAVTDTCQLESVTYSTYCNYRIERNDGTDWTIVDTMDYEVTSTIESTALSNHKMKTDYINFAIPDCAAYRIVQYCPPSGNVHCGELKIFDLDLEDCNPFTLDSLITAPTQDTFCIGQQVTVYIPGLDSVDAVWSNGINSTNTTVQLDSVTALIPGTHEFSVTVTDNDGCMGMDTISLVYEECPLSYCERNDINIIIDLEIDSSLSFWLDSIPHTINNMTGLVTVRSQNIAVSSNVVKNLVCDVDVVFILCDILFERNSGIETNNSLTLTSSNLIPCASDDRWRNLKINQNANLRTLGGTQIIRTSGIIADAANDVNIFQSYIELSGNGTGIFIKDVVNYWDISSTEITQTSIGIHINNSKGLIYDCNINEFSWNGIRLNNKSDGTVISNNRFTESSNFNAHIDESAILSRSSLPFIIGNNINSNHGVKLDNNTLSFVEDNVITTDRTSLQSFRTHSIVENNFLTTNGIGSLLTTLNFTPVITLNASTTTTMFNNVITRDGLGSGVLSQGSTGFLTMINNDITAGGNLGFFSLSAISNNGTQSNRTHFEGNVINCKDAPGISNLSSAGTDMICNDIISVNGPFGGSFTSSGIWNDIDSDNAYLETNTLQAPIDLRTVSIIRQMDSNGDGINDHLGNCFNGDMVEAVGLTPFELQQSTFFVDPNTDPCFIPNEVLPAGSNWFRPDQDIALSCSGLPGTTIAPGDTTNVCRYLDFLNEQLQDTMRRDLTLMRLISLFRMYNDTTITEDTVVPDCLKVYLDTTSVCGIKMLLNMDSLVTTATLGSDTIRFDIQVQSTLTYLTLQQWLNYEIGVEGNTQAEKDSLRQSYIRELTKLKSLIQIKREEEDRIWTEIDSMQIVECLDSIFILEMLAFKLMPKDSFSVSEQTMIDGYARRCVSEYGRGVHLFRALASRFSKEDYRVYDLDCGTEEERSIQPRSRKGNDDPILIKPNPSNGDIIIDLEGELKASKLYITDIMGHIHYEVIDPSGMTKIKLLESGLYVATIIYKDGSSNSEKFVVLD